MSTTKPLPFIRIHAGGTCAEEPFVEIEGFVCEVGHVDSLAFCVPVAMGLCECATLISDGEIKRIGDLAIERLAPAHAARQAAVANGAEIVTEIEACEKLKIGHTKFWELIRQGVLPQPMKRGQNNIWILAELQRRYAATLVAAGSSNKKAPNRHERRKLTARK